MKQTPDFDIPTTSDYAVSVGGRPAAVYAMPTRYGQTLENGKPISAYDGVPLRRPMYFACADITIRNVSVLHATTGPRSEISGYAPDKRFENITIENLRYRGQPVTDAAGMGLKVNEHVADLRFAKNGNMGGN